MRSAIEESAVGQTSCARPACHESVRAGWMHDTNVADETNVTGGEPGPATAEADATMPTDGPALEAFAPTTHTQRGWAIPNAPAARARAATWGRGIGDAAGVAVKATVKAIATVARSCARGVTAAWHTIDMVPPALKVFAVAGLFLLLGITGALGLPGFLHLICTAVVIPISAMTLGALGHRWYSGLDATATSGTASNPAQPALSDLKRSLEYVDAKLAVALTSYGTERHQQAVIALFQAKTAAELTLGTDADAASTVNIAAGGADEIGLRPRIRAGSKPTSLVRESNSLAAS